MCRQPRSVTVATFRKRERGYVSRAADLVWFGHARCLDLLYSLFFVFSQTGFTPISPLLKAFCFVNSSSFWNGHLWAAHDLV